MAPPSRRAEEAEISPEILTVFRTACAAVAALISIRPPAAAALPETSIKGCPLVPEAVGIATCKKPSPLRSSVACSPEPRPILPSGALIDPGLETVPPSKPTRPPKPVVIEPAFVTLAEAPRPVKWRLPELKSLLEMPSVEATKPPPTLTAPDGVKAMPLGLTR